MLSLRKGAVMGNSILFVWQQKFGYWERIKDSRRRNMGKKRGKERKKIKKKKKRRRKKKKKKKNNQA